MARSSGSFIRSKSRFKEQPKVLIICEDSKSGLNYLQDACEHFRIEVQVRVINCGKTNPVGIVNEAIKQQNIFDQIYCVIDRDNHPHFNQAITTAAAHHNIKTISSNPCFEFWLLLHFGYTRRPYNSTAYKSSAEQLIHDLQQKPGMESYSKGSKLSLFDALKGEPFEMAQKNSRKIIEEAIADGNFNPSTQIHLLISEFSALSKPMPI